MASKNFFKRKKKKNLDEETIWSLNQPWSYSITGLLLLYKLKKNPYIFISCCWNSYWLTYLPGIHSPYLRGSHPFYHSLFSATTFSKYFFLFFFFPSLLNLYWNKTKSVILAGKTASTEFYLQETNNGSFPLHLFHQKIINFFH